MQWLLIAFGLLMAVPAAAQNTWSAAGSMSTGRVLHTFTALPDGRGLAVGGKPSSFVGAVDTAEAYDPVSNTWSLLAPMGTARADHTATVLADGRVLVVGGCANGAPCNPPSASAQVYNPATNRWSAAGSLHEAEARAAHTANRLPDGRVLLAGGCGGSYCASAEIFNPANGRWLRAPAMTLPRVSQVSLTMQDGRVVVAGGIYYCESEFGFCFSTRAVDVYDPKRGRWSVFPGLLEPRADFAGTVLTDGRLLISGGDDGISDPKATAEVQVPGP